MALLVIPEVLSHPGCAQAPRVFGSDGSRASVLQPLCLSVPGILLLILDPVKILDLPLCNEFPVLARSQRHSWLWGRSTFFSE